MKNEKLKHKVTQNNLIAGVIGLLFIILVITLVFGGSEQEEAQDKQQSKLLEVAVMDWTENNPPAERAEIWVRGHGSWFLDLEFEGDGPKALGEFPVGELRTDDFYVYPDGRNGAEINVGFEMTEDMISGSTQARTFVRIYDDHVQIVGTAIPSGEYIHTR